MILVNLAEVMVGRSVLVSGGKGIFENYLWSYLIYFPNNILHVL